MRGDGMGGDRVCRSRHGRYYHRCECISVQRNLKASSYLVAMAQQWRQGFKRVLAQVDSFLCCHGCALHLNALTLGPFHGRDGRNRSTGRDSRVFFYSRGVEDGIMRCDHDAVRSC